MTSLIAGKTLDAWLREHPLLQDLMALRQASWFNPALQPAAQALPEVGLTLADIDDAADRLRRFAPYLAETFADTRASGGIIESPLVAVGEVPGQIVGALVDLVS